MLLVELFGTSFCRGKFLSLVPISVADVSKAITRLKSLKSVGLASIPGFVIKGCSGIFIPVLRYIFNLSLAQQHFPTVWKEAAIVLVFKRCNRAAASNYRPNSIFNNFSKLFELIIHDHAFIKYKHTVTNLITFLDFMTLLVRSQRQADAIYFDIDPITFSYIS
jgi:hypothetical protein